MENKIKSPIAYMGNKFTLVDILEKLFPKDIDTFFDVFGGSGVMSLNFGKRALYNEIIPFTKGIVELSIKKSKELREQCEKWFEEYDLNNDRSTEELQEKFKEDYNRFRAYVNSLEKESELHIFGVYALHVRAINNLIRFNRNGDYNASAGFKPMQGGSLKKLEEFDNFNKEIVFYSKDFEVILNNIVSQNYGENTLVYFDPPYLNTTAVYNEKRGFGGWNINEDYRLFKAIDTLKQTKVKWAYSNTLVGKDGTENKHIEEWANRNGYYINYIDKVYHTFGKKNTNNKEVLITNYKVEIE